MREQPGRRGGRRGRGPLHEDHVHHGPFRIRRGDVRSALLIALVDGPSHGYDLIQMLESKTEGRWRPSPGAVYPALQLLADEGLVTVHEQDAKRIFTLTDQGRAEADRRIEADGYPWDTIKGDRQPTSALRDAVRDLHLAAKQIGVAASPDTVTRATEIITEARKDLYRLLADS